MKLFDRSTITVDLALDRLAVLETDGSNVVRWADMPLARGALNQGDPVDSRQLGVLLADIVQQSGMKARRARLTISDEAAVTRIVHPPRMPRRHLELAVPFLAEREMPFPTDRARFAWDLVTTGEGRGVMMAGAWKDVVDRIVEVAATAGLEPTVVEPRSLTLARALGIDSAVVIETGSRQASATVLQDFHLAHLDHVPWSSDPQERAYALHHLVEKVVRSQPSMGQLPIVVAGDLESFEFETGFPAVPASRFLNGHRPQRPERLPAGRFLANLGLAMR